MTILTFLMIILIFIVLIGIINEKFFHIQSDIALIMFSFIISLILLMVSSFLPIEPLSDFIVGLGDFGFEKYLMDGVLCFMLFAGASKVNMNKFRQNVRAISLPQSVYLRYLPHFFPPCFTESSSMRFPIFSESV